LSIVRTFHNSSSASPYGAVSFCKANSASALAYHRSKIINFFYFIKNFFHKQIISNDIVFYSF
ncbi:hypothetical protein, partial [Capnocytophaga canimorsus]|uniref:hypothetical protein n=1 Tax=Capnocytophaga canimorsus TaxID=28188 RepID=UPI0012FD8636